jgi:hypothetical protein
MVSVLGNSHERVLINDLNDIIYYRQKKEYTDQEFANSKDLQREKNAGRILVIETHSVRSSLPESVAVDSPRQTSTLNLNEIKKVVSEVMNEQKQNTGDMVPLLISAIRQEMAGMAIQRPAQSETLKTYEDPTYVPEIKMDNLKSSINIESIKTDDNLSDSIEALKKLGQK